MMKIKIPIEIVELDNNSFHLFIDGYINGHRCSFIIDTGASKTVFALNHIQDMLTETPVEQPEVQSATITSFSIESHSGTISEFRLGELMILNMNVILIDLSGVNELYQKVTNKSIWGLIGSDLLLKYKAKIDYDKRILCLKVPRSNNNNYPPFN